MEIYQVDAFTELLFSGNPAAIVPLQKWVDTNLMQQIALENSLSETAFFVQEDADTYHIRWFTPQTEVDLCGHATLAAAHVLYNHLNFTGRRIKFLSRTGKLIVEKSDTVYWLDFPSQPPSEISSPKLLPDAIDAIPVYTGLNEDLIVLVDSEQTVREMNPDLSLIKQLDVRGVIVTAESEDDQFDFVSRFFAPSVGIPEDPVTGSAHTVLIPFWSKRLNKDSLLARQVSKRGGILRCEQGQNDRVKIGGTAVTYLKGKIHI